MLDPYTGAIKIALYVALASAVIGVPWYASNQRAERIEAQAALADVRAELEIQMANTEMARVIARRIDERERARSPRVEAAKKEVRRVAVPVPQACLPALAPLRSSLDGVRALEKELGSPAPALPRVSGDSGSTYLGGAGSGGGIHHGPLGFRAIL